MNANECINRMEYFKLLNLKMSILSAEYYFQGFGHKKYLVPAAWYKDNRKCDYRKS